MNFVHVLVAPVFGVCLLFSVNALTDVSLDIKKRISSGLEEGRPDIEIVTISKSPLKDLYKVELANGPTLYADDTGRYFFAGGLYEVLDGRVVNVTEKERAVERKNILAQLGQEDGLVYFNAGDNEKGFIYVFTDVNCGFCRRFHKEYLPEAREKGIGIKYFAYPIIGGDKSRTQMVSAWCSEDANQALSDLKEGRDIETKKCESHPIDKHLSIGEQFQVSGTPAVFLPNGEKVNLNYLEQVIDRHFDSSAIGVR